MKRIAVLGSTGSIGTTTLEVVRHLGSEFSIEALAVHSNIDLLEKQIQSVQPRVVAVFDEERAEQLRARTPNTSVLSGLEGLLEVSMMAEVDLVVAAIVGTTGILPTLRAIEAGKDVALANKEALVSAGALVMKAAQEKGVAVLPVDSEHSALFQCLNGERKGDIRRLILTASGGPFRDFEASRLANVSIHDALAHPNWSMGRKVTIDSSTLMNKGLEVLEAHWLYGVPLDQIDVVIHPQSIVHSMVEFMDGSVMAQLSPPDMALPIQYALTYPQRVKGISPRMDFSQVFSLDFRPPDTIRFPCLELAYRAGRAGKSLPSYLNAANEVLVERFLNERIGWVEIGDKLTQLLDHHSPFNLNSVQDVLTVDRLAREEATTV